MYNPRETDLYKALKEKIYNLVDLEYFLQKWQNEGVHIHKDIYWALFGDYIVSGNDISFSDLNRICFHASIIRKHNPESTWLMEPSEKAVFNLFPDSLKVYRGQNLKYLKGWSWTTKKPIAEYFATLHRPNTAVVSGRVEKEDIWAFFNRKGEYEIFVSPHDVKDISEIKWNELTVDENGQPIFPLLS